MKTNNQDHNGNIPKPTSKGKKFHFCHLETMLKMKVTGRILYQSHKSRQETKFSVVRVIEVPFFFLKAFWTVCWIKEWSWANGFSTHLMLRVPSGSCSQQTLLTFGVFSLELKWGVKLWAAWVNHQLHLATHLWMTPQRSLERGLRKALGQRSFILIFPPVGRGKNKGEKPQGNKSDSSLHCPYSKGSSLQSFFFFFSSSFRLEVHI